MPHECMTLFFLSAKHVQTEWQPHQLQAEHRLQPAEEGALFTLASSNLKRCFLLLTVLNELLRHFRRCNFVGCLTFFYSIAGFYDEFQSKNYFWLRINDSFSISFPYLWELIRFKSSAHPIKTCIVYHRHSEWISYRL